VTVSMSVRGWCMMVMLFLVVDRNGNIDGLLDVNFTVDGNLDVDLIRLGNVDGLVNGHWDVLGDLVRNGNILVNRDGNLLVDGVGYILVDGNRHGYMDRMVNGVGLRDSVRLVDMDDLGDLLHNGDFVWNGVWLRHMDCVRNWNLLVYGIGSRNRVWLGNRDLLGHDFGDVMWSVMVSMVGMSISLVVSTVSVSVVSC